MCQPSGSRHLLRRCTRLRFPSKNRGPQLNSKSRTVQRRGFSADTDFLRMQSKSFRLHRTERANNHIKQGDTVFFARNPIGVTYNQLSAILTRTFHNSPLQKTTFNIRNRPDGTERTLNAIEKCIVISSTCSPLHKPSRSIAIDARCRLCRDCARSILEGLTVERCVLLLIV